ncbi:MAG: sensor histidine kinase [Saprospiraceae bacterium]|nr:sensor histidine kinase [Saprospiraceae bacterium]
MRTVVHFICWLCWLCPGLLFAQTGKASAAPTAMDRAKVDSLNDLSFFTEDTAAARKYGLEAQALAQKILYQKGLSDSYVRLGQAAFATQNWVECEQYHRKALAEREKLGSRPDMASCYNELGKLYKTLGKSDSAVTLYQQGLSMMQDQPPHINTIVLNSNLGHLYSITGKYELAKKHLETAVQLYHRLMRNPPADYTPTQLEFKLASLRLDIAEFLQSALHQYPAAKDSLLKSLETFNAQGMQDYVAKCLLLLGNNAYFSKDLDVALSYYEKGIGLGVSIRQTDLTTLIRNRGRVHLDQGHTQKALQDFHTSLAAAEKHGQPLEIAAAQSELGHFYNELSRTDSAIHYYKLALDHDIQDPVLKGRLLYFMADILYQAGKETDSQNFTRLYIQHLEGLNAEQMRGAFANLNWQFVDKNRLLRRIAREEKETQKIYALIALSILSLLAIISILGARMQRQKRRLAEREAEIAQKNEEKAQKDKEIARQNEKIAIREKLDLLKNMEMETNYARLEAQDERQQQIGRELHDSLGAMLTTVRLRMAPVDEVLDVLPTKARDQYREANRLLSDACEELRRISHNLSSVVLMQLGLEEQLKSWASVIPLKVELATHGLKERLDFKTELNLFRIVQELVHNVIKHAHAQNLSIQVNRFQDVINVMIEDDGKGYIPENIRSQPGLGLQSLAARVHDLKGEIQIDSQPGRGTTVSIDIPLKKKQH